MSRLALRSFDAKKYELLSQSFFARRIRFWNPSDARSGAHDRWCDRPNDNALRASNTDRSEPRVCDEAAIVALCLDVSREKRRLGNPSMTRRIREPFATTH